MSSLSQKFENMSENQWRFIILFTSGFVLLSSYYCLVLGITTVFTHLYYIPIILLAYRYHRKGVFYSLILGILYLFLSLYSLSNDIIELAGALERFTVFIIVAIVVAYLSAYLERERQKYKSLSSFNESIVVNAQVWLAVMDQKGTIAVWNKAAEEISGYTPDEVLKKNTIWKLIYPDAAYRKEIARTITTITREKRFFENFTTAIQAKNGERKMISWNTRAIPDDEGCLNRFVAIGIDITERKKAEAELRAAYEQLTAQEQELRHQYDELGKSQHALAESEEEYRNILRTAMDGFCIVDATGSFIDVNDAFCKMLGYSREEMLSLSLRSIEAVETPEDIDRHKKEIIRKGEDRFETRYRCKDDRIINVEVSVVLTGDRDKHFVTFHRDITERKMAEDALNRATKKLNLLNFITFTDIQNAIFALSAYLELEKHVPMDEKQQQYMDKQIGIVRTITESLTFANQYQNLGLKPPAWQSVTQTFLFGISHLDISAFSRKLDVEGLEIYTDLLLEQVFFTLAENVVVHGKTATGIRLYYQKSADGLTLVFENDGTGIPKDMKEKIFERRYEEKKGLGLFLAREILGITGITIKETGEAGKGARFEITVPEGAYRFAGTQ